jgi:predicted phosphohydrolase
MSVKKIFMPVKKISFQLYSDLHLELKKAVPKPKPIAPYLILAGDITKVSHNSHIEFFDYCNKNWEKTFYIMGNHDYWNPNSSMQSIKQQILDINKQNQLTNIVLLDNEVYSLTNDIDIVGSTFWTRSPFMSEYEGKMYINDYNMIRALKNVCITPNYVNALYANDKNFISTYLNETIITNKKCIVITHFPPQRTGTSHPQFENTEQIIKNYFTHPDTMLSGFNNLSNVLCWISGHTHFSYDLASLNGVRLISNQAGYTREEASGETNFKEDGLFEVEY